ncbi:lipopolysaccharide biosynthesis protein [Rubrivirga sp. IMCC43871]|uniref:lipopolysaccharide biosynthesis protein n=1 Tax=Rubrivirga sp. IMCC43871 TaxID=3391575 RepID=UPI00398FF57B
MRSPSDGALSDPPSVVGGRDGVGQRSIRSGFARFGEQGSVLLLSIGSTAALARLLTPEDFGLIAMVSVLASVVYSVRHFGLPMALVHSNEIRPEAAAATFWATVALGGGICLLMAAGGPLLAWFFGEPRLVGLTAATAVGLFVLALGAPHEAVLMREMRFGVLSVISVGAVAVGMAAGVAAAWSGAGVWALIVQLLVTESGKTVLYWAASGWRPSWQPRTWRHSGLRAIAGYSAPYAGFGVLEHVGRRLDRILIGYVGGASVLGLYQNAYRWSLFPLQQVFAPLSGVAVSGLSRVQGEAAVFRGYVQRSMLPVLALVLPTLAFVVVAADPIVRVLLGSQWLAATPLLRWLAAAAFLRCFSKVAQWLFLAEGRTRQQFRWGLVSTPVMVVAVVIGVQWGVYGVAVGFFVGTAVLAVPELAVALHGSVVQARDLVSAAWRPVLGAVLAGLAEWAAAGRYPGGAILELCAGAAVFTSVYVAVWLGLPGGRASIRQVFALLRALRPAPVAPASP